MKVTSPSTLVTKYEPIRRYPSEHLQPEEIQRLLDACDNNAYGKRNRALITVMYRGGLRLAEALALHERDIDFKNQSVRILHGKGDKARTAGLDRHALEIVQEWMVAREAWHLPWETPLFCTRKGGPIFQAYIRVMLPRLAKKARVQRRVHAHIFRHTFAVELSRAGVPVRDIQLLLGHSSLATTSIYLASLSPEEALDRIREREW